MRHNPSRLNAVDRRLRRIEDKLDVLLSDINRIHARLLTRESQLNEVLIKATVNGLHASAVSMKEMAERELRAVKECYGTSGI